MSNLVSKASSAVIWNIAFNLFRDLLQFGTMIILVRILRPESYGQFALVSSIMGFLSIFAHNNFMAHLLQVKDESEVRYQEHFTASAVLQAGIFLLTNVIGLGLQWVPTYGAISTFIHVMSIFFLLDWPCALRVRMLERQFKWEKLRLLQAIGLLIGAVLALTMAMMGAGTYSLLVPGLVLPMPFIYDLFVNERWRPTWAWSWDRYQPAWRFGLARGVGGLAVRTRQLMEAGILTTIAGFAMMGIFNRAIGLAQIFCQKFSEQLLIAIYPILTRISGEDSDQTRISGLLLRSITWVVIPAAVVCSSLAAPVVITIYGSQWRVVVEFLPWAMAWGAFSAISHATYMLLLAKNQTRLCTNLDLGMLLATGAALLGSLQYGLTAYLVLVSGLQMAAAVVMMRWLVNLDALSWQGIIDAFMPAIVASISAWLGANLIYTQIFELAPSSVATAFFFGTVFSILYLVLLRFLFVRQVINLVAYFPGHQRIFKALALKVES
jgi:PST family polysaccharide transporter